MREELPPQHPYNQTLVLTNYGILDKESREELEQVDQGEPLHESGWELAEV